MKVLAYAAFAVTVVLYLMLAPTVGHMIMIEGNSMYAWPLALIPGTMFYVARAGYEKNR